MATGTTTLLLYGLCCGMVAVSVMIAAGLIWYGQRAEKQRKADREADMGDEVRGEQAPVSMRADSSNDRGEQS